MAIIIGASTTEKIHIFFAVIIGDERALGGLYYYAYFNQTEYRRFKTAYQKELLGEPHEFSSANLPAAVLKNIRNDYRKTMEEGYIFMSLAYLLSIAEAYVDAHLRNFDINEDLSGHLGPAW